MPNLGFWEIVVIAVVALIVLGPDKLPGAARQAGAMMRELRKHTDSVKQELREVIDVDEVTQLGRDLRGAVDIRGTLDGTPDGTPNPTASSDNGAAAVNGDGTDGSAGSSGAASAGLVDASSLLEDSSESQAPRRIPDDAATD